MCLEQNRYEIFVRYVWVCQEITKNAIDNFDCMDFNGKHHSHAPRARMICLIAHTFRTICERKLWLIWDLVRWVTMSLSYHHISTTSAIKIGRVEWIENESGNLHMWPAREARCTSFEWMNTPVSLPPSPMGQRTIWIHSIGRTAPAWQHRVVCVCVCAVSTIRRHSALKQLYVRACWCVACPRMPSDWLHNLQYLYVRSQFGLLLSLLQRIRIPANHIAHNGYEQGSCISDRLHRKSSSF